MTGYAEGIILFNLVADALLLYVTGVLIGRKIKLARLLAASFAGTIPILLFLATDWNWLLHAALQIIMPIFMVSIVFKITGFTVLASTVLTFYLVAFLTGGILYGFQSMFYSQPSYGQLPIVIFFIVSVAISFYFIQRRVFSLSVTRQIKKQTVPVSFSLCGITWSGDGLIDTGNALCDPISKKEVAVCQIRPSEQWPEALRKGEHEQLLQLPDCWKEKLAWIPAKTIHTENQLLAAFRTDEFTVWIDGKEIKKNRALVTFTDKTLSDEESFFCILHPNMVRE